MSDSIAELLVTDVALDKLGARGIAFHDARQIPRNVHVVAHNPHETSPGRRRLLIGRTDGRSSFDAGHRADRRPDDLADRHRLGLVPTGA